VEIWPQQNKKHLEAYPYYLGSFGTHIIIFLNAEIFPENSQFLFFSLKMRNLF
jgi:hypothetical protein